MKTKISAFSLLIVMLFMLFGCSKNVTTIEDLEKASGLDLPENAEVIRVKKVGILQITEIYMHLRVPKDKIAGFAEEYLLDDSIIKSKGFTQGERYFLEWSGLSEDSLEFKYLFKKSRSSPTSKSAYISEIVLILNPESEYQDVYIYKAMGEWR